MPSTFLVRPSSAEPDRRILVLQASVQALRQEFADGVEALSTQMSQLQHRVEVLEGIGKKKEKEKESDEEREKNDPPRLRRAHRKMPCPLLITTPEPEKHYHLPLERDAPQKQKQPLDAS